MAFQEKTILNQCYISASCGPRPPIQQLQTIHFVAFVLCGTITNCHRMTKRLTLARFVTKNTNVWFLNFLCHTEIAEEHQSIDGAQIYGSIFHGPSGPGPPFLKVGHFECSIGHYTHICMKICIFCKRNAPSNQCRIWATRGHYTTHTAIPDH